MEKLWSKMKHTTKKEHNKFGMTALFVYGQHVFGKTMLLTALLLLAFPMIVNAAGTAEAQTFLDAAVGPLRTMAALIGAGMGIWGVVNLIEGYGNDNPGAKSQGIKQLMAGIAMVFLAFALQPILSIGLI